MKRLLTLLAVAAISLVIPACHDDDDHAHVTTTTTSTEHTTRVAPSTSSTVVERY